jgi:hypothetical protein
LMSKSELAGELAAERQMDVDDVSSDKCACRGQRRETP